VRFLRIAWAARALMSGINAGSISKFHF